MCLAKAVGGGLPLGITIAKQDVMSSLKLGEHSTTFGGNPLVCAAASAAIDVLITERLAEKASELGAHFIKRLQKLQAEHSIVREVRGVGLMIGVETRFDVLNILQKLMAGGVIALDAGRNIVRFLPPLVISREQLDTVANSLDKVLTEEEDERLRGSATD
jgi:acetylornithine/LysW-gamma-L-lysine aminotransferase